MGYPVLSLEELHLLTLQDLENRIPEADVSPGSDDWVRQRVQAGAVTDAHAHISSQGRDAMPDTAEGDVLDRWLAIKGSERRGATAASGAQVLRVYGTAASVLDGTETLVHSSGRTYTCGAGVIPAAGYLDVDVACDTTGADGSLAAGEYLRFSAPPTGIQQTARLQSDLTPGTDKEIDGPARTRLLALFAQAAAGGNRADYERWLFDLDDTLQLVCVYPNRNGLGSVDLAVFRGGQGSARIVGAGDLATLLAALEPLVPCNLDPDASTIRLLTTTEEVTDIELLVEAQSSPDYAWDWNDSTPPAVSAWDGATRTLTLDARPATLQAGHRIVIEKTDGTGTGKEAEVEALSGADAVVLKEAPSFTPAATDNVYAGGPLVEPIRQAVLDHVNALGSTPGDFGAGNWLGSLLRSNLWKLAQNTDGVFDSDVSAPAADVVPTDTAFPDDSSIPFVSPGQILVRRRWS